MICLSKSRTASPANKPMDTLPAEPPTPTAGNPGDRILTFDVLRAVAIMGILIVHFTSDFPGLWLMTPAERDALPSAPVNLVVDRFISLFIVDKSRTIFSFMFGISFYFQLNSANRRGIAFRPLFLRRLAVLFVIGLLHAHLLYGGDILRYYVVGGLFLLLAYRWPVRWLLYGGILLTLVAPMLTGLFLQMVHIDAVWLNNSVMLKSSSANSYRDYLRGDQLWATWFYTPGMLQLYFIPVLGNFLLGVWMARMEYIHKTAQHQRPLKRLFWLGLGVGVSGKAALFVLGGGHLHQWLGVSFVPAWLSVLLWNVGYEALALCYICGIALLCQSVRWQRRLAVLAPAGRMTLTNYVGQSVVGILIFSGVGLGLSTKIGSALCLLLALVLCGLQLGANRWWLQRFRLGPLEWAWRSLAAGKRLPMHPEQSVGAFLPIAKP